MAQSSGGTHAAGVPGASGTTVLALGSSDGVVAVAVGASVGKAVSITGELDGAPGGFELWRVDAGVEDRAMPMAQAKGPLPTGSNHKSVMSVANATIRMIATQMSSRVSRSGQVLGLSSGLVFLRFMPSTE
jgi:hypothetical protein